MGGENVWGQEGDVWGRAWESELEQLRSNKRVKELEKKVQVRPQPCLTVRCRPGTLFSWGKVRGPRVKMWGVVSLGGGCKGVCVVEQLCSNRRVKEKQVQEGPGSSCAERVCTLGNMCVMHVCVRGMGLEGYLPSMPPHLSFPPSCHVCAVCAFVQFLEHEMKKIQARRDMLLSAACKRPTGSQVVLLCCCCV